MKDSAGIGIAIDGPRPVFSGVCPARLFGQETRSAEGSLCDVPGEQRSTFGPAEISCEKGMLVKFRGVYGALATPMDDDGSAVDHTRLQELASDLTSRGTSGVLVNGTTGEFSSLSEDERRGTVQAVAEAVSGSQVLVNVGAITTAEALRHTEHAQEQGASAVLLGMPYHQPLGEGEIIDYVTAVAAVGTPVVLYRIPDLSGYDMPVDLLARCAEIPGVLAVKESSGSLLEVQDLMSAHDHVQPIIGWDGLMYPALALGVEATVWGLANVVPDACVALLNTALERDWESAIQQWHRSIPWCATSRRTAMWPASRPGARSGECRSVDPVPRCGRLPQTKLSRCRR